jgi:hypothetical protein
MTERVRKRRVYTPRLAAESCRRQRVQGLPCGINTLYFHRQSYKQDLWAAAFTLLSGCGDDAFDYFRFWLITQGKDIYNQVVQDADSLCDVIDGLADLHGEDYPMNEELDYIPMRVFEEKFKKDFHAVEAEMIDYKVELPLPKITREWKSDDEDSIKRICPKIFDKWWEVGGI